MTHTTSFHAAFLLKNNYFVASNLEKFVWMVSTNSHTFAPTDTEKAWELSNTIFYHSFSTPVQSYFPSPPSSEHCKSAMQSFVRALPKAEGSWTTNSVYTSHGVLDHANNVAAKLSGKYFQFLSVVCISITCYSVIKVPWVRSQENQL